MDYNGYSNYATWRIMLEILSDIEFTDYVTADILKEITDDVVFSNVKDDRALCIDYAKAFIAEVNFYELAQLINEEIDENNK